MSEKFNTCPTCAERQEYLIGDIDFSGCKSKAFAHLGNHACGDLPHCYMIRARGGNVQVCPGWISLKSPPVDKSKWAWTTKHAQTRIEHKAAMARAASKF